MLQGPLERQRRQRWPVTDHDVRRSRRLEIAMKVSRREALGMGALSALGVAALARPFGADAEAKSASRLAARNMPVPYAAKFVRPRVLPFEDMEDSDGRYRLYTVTEQAGIANIVPGLKTPVFGYEGTAPGPT